jgi:hypothetical protein
MKGLQLNDIRGRVVLRNTVFNLVGSLLPVAAEYFPLVGLFSVTSVSSTSAWGEQPRSSFRKR